MNNRLINFKYVILFTAIIIAGSAAYFSVFGLSKLFAKFAFSVIIMAGALEFGKLVAVTFLHAYWKTIAFLHKFYMILCIALLMLITSTGIYGYLSNAYQLTENEYRMTNASDSIIYHKIQNYNDNINKLNYRIKNNDIRIISIEKNKSSQNVRLDSIYSRQLYGSKNIENNLKLLDANINDITILNNKYYDKISQYQDSIIFLENNLLGNKRTSELELASLLYISNLTGIPLNKVVNIFILIIIFVFDPFAISLILAFNHINRNEKTILSSQNNINNQNMTVNNVDIAKNAEVTMPYVNSVNEILNNPNERGIFNNIDASSEYSDELLEGKENVENGKTIVTSEFDNKPPEYRMNQDGSMSSVI